MSMEFNGKEGGYTRPDNTVNVEIKLDKKVSVREATNIVDVAGGQGVLKCNCTT